MLLADVRNGEVSSKWDKHNLNLQVMLPPRLYVLPNTLPKGVLHNLLLDDDYGVDAPSSLLTQMMKEFDTQFAGWVKANSLNMNSDGGEGFMTPDDAGCVPISSWTHQGERGAWVRVTLPSGLCLTRDGDFGPQIKRFYLALRERVQNEAILTLEAYADTTSVVMSDDFDAKELLGL